MWLLPPQQASVFAFLSMHTPSFLHTWKQHNIDQVGFCLCLQQSLLSLKYKPSTVWPFLSHPLSYHFKFSTTNLLYTKMAWQVQYCSVLWKCSPTSLIPRHHSSSVPFSMKTYPQGHFPGLLPPPLTSVLSISPAYFIYYHLNFLDVQESV